MVNGEAATEKKLYDAASKGDLPTFHQLLQGDPYLLDCVSFPGSRNLLHVATIWGQAAIVEEVLSINPQLARSIDAQNSTALHIAAAQGNHEITNKLLRIASETCWWRDCGGMNPIHVAAVNGHVEILEQLIAVDPFPAMEKADRGQTVLHLCVKHRQRRALEFLVGKFDNNFIETKNDDKETLLHLAAKYDELEMIKFLAEKTSIEKASVDSMERTAVEMVTRSHQKPNAAEVEIIFLLNPPIRSPIKSQIEFFERMREQMVVVAVLIATMAFQAAVSPPGGVWQEDSPTHKAGQAVMASTHPKIYRSFVRGNATAFVSSLVTIFLIVVGMNFRSQFLICHVFWTTWLSLVSIALSYGASVIVTTPYIETQSLSLVIIIVVAVSLGIHVYALALSTVLPDVCQWAIKRVVGMRRKSGEEHGGE